ELSALGFGGGIITQLNINKKSNLYTSLHLAGVPLAGSSTRYGPDTTQVRDYNYSSGLEGKFEVTLDLNQLVNFKLSAYYYWTHPYVGQAEDNFEGIIRPRVTLQ